jgi:ribonucleoside-diphosphate reductase alpha chain
MTSKRFFPNSPTFTGAGTPLGQLAACFVLPLSDDMGKSETGIFQTLRNAALVQQTGGGNGFSFSRLRPAKSFIHTSGGQATGPIGFLHAYDQAFGVIAQGGSRRGANMGVLRVDHPDIEEFITCKTSENAITNFNISVALTDRFMNALESDDDFELRFPDVNHPKYRDFDGTLEQAEEAGIPIKVYKTIRARELFDKIVKQAHHNGEPGVLFLDAMNTYNPVPHLYALEATNPCGEQGLGPFENCCLGSINLAQYIDEDDLVNWYQLEEDVHLATRFLDDVVEINAYVPSVPQIREAAMRARRIGLGIMGLADLMYASGVRYGSREGAEFAGQVMEFIRFHSMKASIQLAAERGYFPEIEGSIYDPSNLTWTPPSPIEPFQKNWHPEFTLDWQEIEDGIKQYGIRNAAQTTIAPTGTIATVAGSEGYGCEPVYALAYTRYVLDGDKKVSLTYTSPLFEKAINKAGLENQDLIIDKVKKSGSCQGVAEIPEEIRNVFVVSGDITALEHIRMQSALQAFVDNQISKTINFPETATEEDVAKAYQAAWKAGCRGLTVYVTGSRDTVVLETAETKAKKNNGKDNSDTATPPVVPVVNPTKDPVIWHGTKKQRPKTLVGRTIKIGTPLGEAFVTINENGGSQPFEVFVTTSKAGSETAAISEAMGRIISYNLRLASPVPPRKRLLGIHQQLAGIGGDRQMGFGKNRVRSLADGIAQALGHYLEETNNAFDENFLLSENGCLPNGHADNDVINTLDLSMEDESLFGMSGSNIMELCPECGNVSILNIEGCKRCTVCGVSECS